MLCGSIYSNLVVIIFLGTLGKVHSKDILIIVVGSLMELFFSLFLEDFLNFLF
jgi:hypothetical protein